MEAVWWKHAERGGDPKGAFQEIRVFLEIKKMETKWIASVQK